MDNSTTALFPVFRKAYLDFKETRAACDITSPGSPLKKFFAGNFARRLIFASKYGDDEGVF